MLELFQTYVDSHDANGSFQTRRAFTQKQVMISHMGVSSGLPVKVRLQRLSALHDGNSPLRKTRTNHPAVLRGASGLTGIA